MNEDLAKAIKFMSENGAEIIVSRTFGVPTENRPILRLEALVDGKRESIGLILPPSLGQIVTLPEEEKLPGARDVTGHLQSLYSACGGDHTSSAFDPYREYFRETLR